MVPLPDLLLFAGAAFLVALTPGPNMVYLLSRSICQSRKAGLLSLIGVLAGFLVHMLAAAVGLTALFMAVPMAYEALKWAGAAYLLWLAWQALKPGARSPFEARVLPPDSPARLVAMGFLTNLLNPKIAVFYLSVFPQFITLEHGSVLAQSVLLGSVQIACSAAVNLTVIVTAARLAAWFGQRPLWLRWQQRVMGAVLGALAVRLALDERRA